MKETICMICQESVRVPVRFMFPCKNDSGDLSCNSIQRYCLPCARGYLGLDKLIDDRDLSVKCPLCPATLDPRRLTPARAFEKDFLLMEIDPKSDYPCFWECGFVGRQRDLEKHILNDCQYRIMSCELCMETYSASEESTHRAVCRQRVFCAMCDDYIPSNGFMTHMYEEHQLICCDHCHTLAFIDDMSSHLDVCPSRPVQCVYCGECFTASTYQNHLLYHIRSLRVRLHQLKSETERHALSLQRVSDEFKNFRV